MTASRNPPLLARVRALALAGALVLPALALAGPDDDFKEGVRLYHRGDMVGAMEKLRPAADAGHGPSMSLLAEVLDRSGFTEEAVELYRKAADVADPDGMFALSALLAAGRGMARDDARAYALLEKSAQAGHKQAINVLAQTHIAGGLGRKPFAASDRSGLPWIEKAAANQHLPAVEFLAKGWREGLFGAPDLAKAAAYDKQTDAIRYAGKTPPKRKREAR